MAKGKFSLVGVGDLVPSRRLFTSDIRGDFAKTVEIVQGADISFGDLEMPLSDRGYPREKLIAFHASPDIVPDLKHFGFDVLSLANNHSMDYDYEAMFDTMGRLDAAGIDHIGGGHNLTEAEKPVLLEVNGQRVGFVAWTSLLPLGSSAGENRPGLAPIHVHIGYEVNPYGEMEEPGNPPVVRSRADDEEQQRAIDRIHALRDQVDFLAVSIHWGYGAGEELAEYQRPLGHAFIDAGADVVLGNHVHAIHGVEVYKAKAILYSPGNFIAQQPREGASATVLAILDAMSTDGYIARLNIEPDRSYSLRLIPTFTNSDGLPEVATGDSFRRILERIQRLSQKLDTEVQARDDEILVPVACTVAAGG